MGGIGPTDVPVRRTPIVDREAERAAVREQLLRPEVRLLTLTGAPGIGKTRLAEAVAADVARSFPDGVHRIELVSPGDPSLVAGAVARVLGIREVPGQELISTLADALCARRALLLLDNCEHVTDACADLAGHLLPGSSALRVLVTSRKSLGIPLETVWQVPPLSLPEPGRAVTPAEAMHYAAIRLFVARAPGFTVTQENLAAVIEVCRRLEGIPLALELAAPRLTLLSVEQLATRSCRPLHVLASNPDPLAHHQQTLSTTLAWSHALLSRQQQVLFRRLAVFAGGWTVDAAEAICAGGDVAEHDVLDLLDQLQRHSLLAARGVQQGITLRGALPAVRSCLLEAVREYAAEHLATSGEEEGIRRTYADYYLRLARRADPELRGPGQRAWADGLEMEHDNLRAVLAWSVKQPEPEDARIGLRLAASLWWFWFIRGHLTEGRGWLEQTLSANPDAPPDLRADALSRAGHLAWVQGDYQAADAGCREAETVYQELDDTSGVAIARGIRAYVAFARGRLEPAMAMGEEVLGLMRQAQDPWGEAMACLGLGVAAHRLQEHERARTLLETALSLSRRLGDTRTEAEARNNLGIVAREQGSLAEAIAQHQASLELFRALRDTWQEAGALIDLGTAMLQDGSALQAGAHLRASLQLYRQLGDRRGMVTCLEQLARAASAIKSPVRAARLFGAAEALRETLDLPLPPADREEHDRRVREARRNPDAAQFERAWHAGRALSLDRAIEEALKPDSFLTPREEAVAALVALGLRSKEIAARLGMSEGVVANHLATIRDKLQLQSRTEIAMWAIEHGLTADTDW